MIAGSPDHGMQFSLTGGEVSDFKAGMALLTNYDFPKSVADLAMDKGYSVYRMVEYCLRRDIEPVVPPKSNFLHPWNYNKNVYEYRNEIERLFNRIKNYRRIATRYDKLSIMYESFVTLGLICLLLKILC
jgi:transposase